MRSLLTLLLTLTALASLLSVTSTVSADTLDTPAALQATTERFLASAVDGQLAEAYRALRPFLGVGQAPFDASAREADSYFRRVAEQVGDPIGYSHVLTESIGEDFYRTVWLQKFDTAAIAWTFTFYQPREGWKLVGVSYSTDLASLYR